MLRGLRALETKIWRCSSCIFMFFCIFDTLKKSWKSKVSPPPSNQGFPGPCPDDRAQNSVQDSLNESSVRPNPTLVFSKILFRFWPPQYRTETATLIRGLAVMNKSPPERREVSVWQETIDFVTRRDAKDASRLSGGELFVIYHRTKDKRLAPI